MNIQKQQRNWVSFLGIFLTQSHNCAKNILEPKAETIKILKNRLKNEIELYNFVKDLFYVKLKSFTAKLNSNSKV